MVWSGDMGGRGCEPGTTLPSVHLKSQYIHIPFVVVSVAGNVIELPKHRNVNILNNAGLMATMGDC